MSNPRYRKGYRMEQDLVKMWQKIGFEARRTAGSHGLFDVIAVHPGNMNVVLIQSKNKVLTPVALAKEVHKLLSRGMHSKPDGSVRVYVAYHEKSSTGTKLHRVNERG